MAKCFFLFLVSFSLFAQTSQKPLVEGFQGMVVSTHPVASDVGLTILKKGGNFLEHIKRRKQSQVSQRNKE